MSPVPSRPRIESVSVTITLADGRSRTIKSRPDAINQNEGVRVIEDLDHENCIDGDKMTDMRLTRTVSWVEQWTEMLR